MWHKFLTAAAVAFAIGWSAPSPGAPADWPASLTIGTASPGGVYVVYGEALAQILTEALGIPVSAQATQGTKQNSLLLESVAENAKRITVIPYHPGAVRYYREIGVEIPAASAAAQ